MRSILLRGTIIVSLLLTFASCTTTPQSAGIKPLEPKNGGKAANLQPMLKWAPAENHDGTYDLVIFESIKDDQLGQKERLVEVYFREDLPGGDNSTETIYAPKSAWKLRS